MMAVLHHLLGTLRHAVVTQVVEAELRVRAVRDVAEVLRAALGRIHRVLDAADREAQVPVEMTHPRRVAPRQVVVHRHELHVLARKRVEVERQRRHQRLALARLHLRDRAAVQHDAADELDVERHHVPGQRVAADLLRRPDQVTARVLHERVRLRQQLVQRFALRIAFLERLRHPREVLVREVLRLIVGFDAVDLTNDRPQLLQLAIVLGPEKHFQQIHRLLYYIKKGEGNGNNRRGRDPAALDCGLRN